MTETLKIYTEGEPSTRRAAKMIGILRAAPLSQHRGMVGLLKNRLTKTSKI